jgi:hypothetical protein
LAETIMRERSVESLEPEDPSYIAEYELLGRLGAGGMGRVYLGRSPGGRLVAVKVVHAELVREPESRARFRREVQAARSVTGAFTAPVIDADLDAAQPWLVTSYIAGPSLQEAVTSQGPLPAARVTAFAAGLAEALISIHAANLVHRDLKPSNVLLAEDGPRVIDFGIARGTEDVSITQTGFMVGSPAFMSPEQVNAGEIGPASDVFSLGATLAYAASGTSPFGNGPTPAVLYRIVNGAPDLDSVSDHALRALIADCLAKSPDQRPTPRQILAQCGNGRLAARGQAYESVSRVPAVAPARGQYFGGGATVGAEPGPAPDPRESSARAATRDWVPTPPVPAGTARRRRPTRRTVIFSGLAALVAAGVPAGFYLDRDTTVPKPDPSPKASAGPRIFATFTSGSGSVSSVVFSPDGKTFASGGADGKVRLWNTNGQGPAYSGSGAPIPGSATEELATLTGHTAAVNSVAFSADGKKLASGSSDKTVRLWDAATRRSIATLTGHTGAVNSVAFSPDGESVASGSSDMTIRLWTTSVNQGIATLTGHTGAVNSVTFSPDGKTLASGSADATVRLWSTATQRGTATLTGHTGAVNSVAFSPDNTNFASGSSDTTIRLWNADALKSSIVLVNAAPVYAVAFSYYNGDGYALAAAVQETIQVWDIATQKTTMTLHGGNDTHSKYVTIVPINSLAFGTYGSIWDLVTGDSSGAINLWNPVT